MDLSRISMGSALALLLMSGAALADNPLPLSGQFQADLLVTAVTPTPSTGECGAAVGATLSGVVSFNGSGAGGSFVYRFGVNATSGFGIFTEIFPKSDPHNLTPSGSYSFGMEGGAPLESGTFTTTYQALDQSSLLASNSLTYISPADRTTMCQETDQVTLIRVSN